MASPKDDPLEERRVDPRDLQPLPSRFDVGLGRTNMKPPIQIAPGLAKGQVYWTYGSTPKGLPRSGVDDPPCSGWATVLVVGEPGPRGELQLLCPFSLQAYKIAPGSYESTSLQAGTLGAKTAAQVADYYRETLPRKWAEVKRHGQGRPNWDVAARALSALGVKPPTDEQIARETPMRASRPKSAAAEKPAGKPAAAKTAFKPVKREGRKGEVLKAMLDGETSVEKLTSSMGVTRSNLLSQLFLLRKDHGIGYSVSGDEVILEMPTGVEEPFV